jgi:hypothetical protein
MRRAPMATIMADALDLGLMQSLLVPERGKLKTRRRVR